MRRLFDRVFSGNDEMYAKAARDLDEAIAKFGADHVMKFPDTAYNCAIILQYTGIKVETLGDLKKAMDGPIKEMMAREQRLHDVFTSGFATAMAAPAMAIAIGYGRSGHRSLQVRREPRPLRRRVPRPHD